MKIHSICITLLTVYLTACTGGTLMTMQSFADVPIGSTQSEVRATAGKPDTIRSCSDGTIEYEYVEKIKAGGRDIETRYYILIFKDDVVTAKKIKQQSPPATTFDSFDMQTSQNHLPF